MVAIRPSVSYATASELVYRTIGYNDFTCLWLSSSSSFSEAFSNTPRYLA